MALARSLTFTLLIDLWIFAVTSNVSVPLALVALDVGVLAKAPLAFRTLCRTVALLATLVALERLFHKTTTISLSLP